MIKHSEEHKRKLSLAMKGRNLGYKYSLESRLKMSLAKKGKEFSEDHKKKLSENSIWKSTDKKKLEEARKKQSESHKGKTSPKGMLDKYHSEETKRKMSEGHKGQVAWNKGKKSSKETILKMSESRTKYLQSHKGKFKDTKPELNVKFLLELYDIDYLHQYRVKNSKEGKGGLYDFYLPQYNLLIEVDGTFWHQKGIKDGDLEYGSQKVVRKNDRYKNKLAKQEGYKLHRVWEGEYNKFEKWILKHLFKMELLKAV